jgi:hypothetical protein
VTTAGVGWVLVDGNAPAGHPLDDDEFAVGDLDELEPRCLAAVRGALAIAASSGHEIDSIGISWTADVQTRVAALVEALNAAGCADVRLVRQLTPADGGATQVAAAAEGIEASEDTVADVVTTERLDPSGLLTALFDEEDADKDDVEGDLEFSDLTELSDPDAEKTSAYDAAQAVVTNAVPPTPVPIVRPPRGWNLPASGARMMTIAGAAAVTAVIALFAVGSQFVGAGANDAQALAAAAHRASVSTAHTSQIVHTEPPALPAAHPPAAISEPAAVADVPAALPTQPAVPQTQLTVSAEPPAVTPVAVQQVVPEVVPAEVLALVPDEPVAAPPVVPVAAPMVAPQPEATPLPPPFAPPPFVPPAPEVLPVPAEQLPLPPPAAQPAMPVQPPPDPLFGPPPGPLP